MEKSGRTSDTIWEAERRAEILRRYDEVSARTGEDDERFAAEIGVAIQTFHQLVRSWRRYHDPLRLPGARTRATDEDRQAALVASEKPDLSGVDPARRPLVRDRIGELRKYLSIGNPTRHDEKSAAERLGMSVASFRRLYRSWVMSRDPATLPGGATPARLKRRRRPAINPQVEACITAVIEEEGPGSATFDVYRAVLSLCERNGLKAPSQGAVYSRTIRARSKILPHPDQALMVVDHVALDLLVEHRDGPRLPVLSVVLQYPSQRIVTHHLSLEAPSPASTAHLLGSCLQDVSRSRAEVVPLELGLPKGTAWDRLLEVLVNCQVISKDDVRRSLLPGRALKRLFGEHFGRLRMKPRATMRPGGAPVRKLGGGSVPLSFREASSVVDEIVEAFNDRRDPTPVTFAPKHAVTDLVRALLAF